MPRLLQLGSAVAAVLLIAGQAQANVTNWVVYGDYGNTVRSNNVNRVNSVANQTPSLPLTNFLTGGYCTNLTSGSQVMYFSTNFGTLPGAGTQCTNPTSGPLTAYTNIWNLGGGNNVMVNTNNTNCLVFYNLDPTKRYSFIAGVSRGKPTGVGYDGRWSKAWITSADSYVANHQQGDLSPFGIILPSVTGSGLTGSEVAWWTGGNMAGDLIQWDNIAPGDDGILRFDITQYYTPTAFDSQGTVPGTLSIPTLLTKATDYGYGWDGWALIEYTACDGGFTATLNANSTSLTECQQLVLTASANCGTLPYTFFWNKDDAPIDGSGSTLVIDHVTVADAGSYYVIAYDESFLNPVQTEPVVISVSPDLTDPTMTSPAISTNLSSVTVTFSRPVMFSGSSAFSIMKTNGSDPLTIASVSPEGVYTTTATIETTTPRTGNMLYKVVANAGAIVTCNTLSVPQTNFAIIEDHLILIGLTNETWQFNQSGIDPGSAWLANSYNDTVAPWETGTSVFHQVTNVFSGLPVGTTLLLTNPAYASDVTVPSYLFRKHFTMPSGFDPSKTIVPMKFLIDDGAIFYVNGTEFFRTTNVVAGLNDGFYSYLTNNGQDNNPNLSSTNVYVPPQLLLGGDNVIAVYLKQVTTNNGDITMSLQMSAVISNYAEPRPNFNVTVDPTSIVAAPCGAYTLTANQDFGGTYPYKYQWYLNNNPISLETNKTLKLSVTSAGNYKVVVSDSAAKVYSATSAVVQVTVLPDNPAMLSAMSETDMRTVTVTFDRPVRISSLTGGDFTFAPAIALSAALVDTDHPSNVVITAATDLQLQNYTITVGPGVYSACTEQTASGNIRLVQRLPLSMYTYNATWKYNQSATDLGDAWLANNYDDTVTGWETGTQVFDYKTNSDGTMRITNGPTPISTHLTTYTAAWSNGLATIPSYYFRQHFTLPITPDTNNMTIQYRTFFDDFGVLYMNGQEVYRDSQITTNNYAYTNYSGAPRDATWSNPRSLTNYTVVQKGDNVLAVYLKQGNSTSTDITMGLEVMAIVTNFPPSGPKLTITDTGSNWSIGWAPAGGALWSSTDLKTWTQQTTQNPATVTKAAGYKFFEVRQ